MPSSPTSGNYLLDPPPTQIITNRQRPSPICNVQFVRFFFLTCPPFHSVFSPLPAYRTDLSGSLTPLTTDWFAQCWTIPVRSGTRPFATEQFDQLGSVQTAPSAESIRVEGTFVAFSFGTWCIPLTNFITCCQRQDLSDNYRFRHKADYDRLYPARGSGTG